jgi:hypothetical protein
MSGFHDFVGKLSRFMRENARRFRLVYSFSGIAPDPAPAFAAAQFAAELAGYFVCRWLSGTTKVMPEASVAANHPKPTFIP